jgi:uncharacterized protein
LKNYIEEGAITLCGAPFLLIIRKPDDLGKHVVLRKCRDNIMKNISILLIFFLFVGPGPIAFFINPYTVSLAPVLSLIAILYLLRDEIYQADFNAILKSPEIYRNYQTSIRLCIVVMAVMSLFSGFNKVALDELVVTYAIMPINIVIIAPIIEEIVYRKVMFGWLTKRYHFWVAAIISSLIFAVGHLDLTRIVTYFIIGIILCWYYQRSKSIMVPIFAHITLNLISVIARTLQS